MASPDRIELEVSCTPVGMPRPRSRARQTKGGKWIAQTYQPKKPGRNPKDKAFVAAALFKSAIQDALWRAGRPTAPWDGPIRLDYDVYFERPQYMLAKKWPDGPIPHTAKPDRDNIEKAIMDALKAAGLMADDAQVCCGEPRKWYAARDAGPGVVLLVERVMSPAGDLFGGPR